MKRFKVDPTRFHHISFFKNAAIYNKRSGIYVLGYVSTNGIDYEQMLVDIKLISDVTKMSAVSFLRQLKDKAINIKA